MAEGEARFCRGISAIQVAEIRTGVGNPGRLDLAAAAAGFHGSTSPVEVAEALHGRGFFTLLSGHGGRPRCATCTDAQQGSVRAGDRTTAGARVDGARENQYP